MSSLISIIANIFSSLVPSALAQHLVDKSFDALVGCFKPRSHDDVSLEEQLLDCLDTSLRDVCAHYGLEYDDHSIGDTFIISLKELGDITLRPDDGCAFKEILTCALGIDADDVVLEYWSCSFLKEVSSKQHLCSFLGLIKLDAILHEHIEEDHGRLLDTDRYNDFDGSKVIQDDIDIHGELLSSFDDLFGCSTEGGTGRRSVSMDIYLDAPDDGTGISGSIDDHVASEEGTDKDVSPMPATGTGQEENDDHGRELIRIPESRPNGPEFIGKYFSLTDPLDVFTIAFQVQKVALPGRHKITYYPIRLDSSGEFIGNDVRRTFYIDCCDPEGTPLVFLRFYSKRDLVAVTTGFLYGSSVKISRDPMYLNSAMSSSEISSFLSSTYIQDHIFSVEKIATVRPYRFSYSFDLESIFVIIDPVTGEVVKPVLQDLTDPARGYIDLKPYKTYVAFNIRSQDGTANYIDDYDIGLAYKYGRLGLKTDYGNAFHYLTLAEESGDMRAKAELVGLYENGLGCFKDPDKADQLIKNINEYNMKILVEREQN